ESLVFDRTDPFEQLSVERPDRPFCTEIQEFWVWGQLVALPFSNWEPDPFVDLEVSGHTPDNHILYSGFLFEAGGIRCRLKIQFLLPQLEVLAQIDLSHHFVHGQFLRDAGL